MSIIRRRHKNMFIAGCIGFFVALIVITILYASLIRGNQKAMNWILNDSQLQINEVKKEQPVKIKTYILMEGISQGETVTKEMLMAMEVEERIIPEKFVDDITHIIGRTAAVDIPAKAILTESFFGSSEVETDSMETVEIRLESIPEIIGVGDVVNLRIHFPSGQNYLLLGQKEVIHMNTELNFFFAKLTTVELMALSSALEDCNKYPGTRLYLTRLDGISEGDEVAGDHAYPVNPNVLMLSRMIEDRQKVLNERKTLDDSLTYHFEQVGLGFDYGAIDETTLSLAGETSSNGKMSKDMENNDSGQDEVLGQESSGQSNQEKDDDSDSALSSAKTSNTSAQTQGGNSSDDSDSSDEDKPDFDF